MLFIMAVSMPRIRGMGKASFIKIQRNPVEQLSSDATPITVGMRLLWDLSKALF